MYIINYIINFIKKLLFYDFKLGKFAFLKLLLLFFSSSFFFYMFISNKYFISFLNEYYIVINNYYFEKLVSNICNLYPCNKNLTVDSYNLFIFIIIIWLIFLVLFILGFFLKLLRLLLLWMCGNFITFLFCLFRSYFLNINEVINLYSIDIRRKLTCDEKIQFILDIRDKFIFNLEPGIYIDKSFNSDVLYYLLTRFKDINHPFILENEINIYLWEHVIFMDISNNTNTKLVYLAIFIGLIFITSLSCIFYFTAGDYPSSSDFNRLANIVELKSQDLDNEKLITRILANDVKNLKEKVSDLNENVNSLDKLIGQYIISIEKIEKMLSDINDKLNLW